MANDQNIIPHRFKPGQSGNPNGRPKNRVKQEWLPLCLGKKRAKAMLALTGDEINSWEQLMLVATSAELQALVKGEDAPSYAKNLAMAILRDTKDGRTSTIDKLRERQYGKTVQRIELTGADGESLNPQPLAIEIIDRREQVQEQDGSKA